ncbi:MAG: hypothetical protein ACOZNI_32350 [Myxococcota bacterium]
MRSLPALLFAACPSPEPEPRPNTSPNTVVEPPLDDTGADAEGCPLDAGCVATAFWVGEMASDAGAFVSATFGWAWYGRYETAPICVASGQLSYVGPAPDGCPACTWAWDLSALAGTTAEGPYCVGGDLDVTDGALDGTTDYAWGFAASYVYDYNGTPLYFEDTLLLWAEGYAWFPFAFNLPAYAIYQVEGDAGALAFARGIKDASGSYVTYTYER